jgi:hypothetical protein
LSMARILGAPTRAMHPTVRPSMLCVCRHAIAAISGSLNVTKPKPRGFCVMRSRMTTCMGEWVVCAMPIRHRISANGHVDQPPTTSSMSP